MVGVRGALAIAGATLVTGCDGVGLLPGGEATETLAVRGGAVTVTGVQGYCVDPSSSRARSGFALMGACATLTGEGPLPFPNAVITVQVGPQDSASVAADPEAFAAFVQSEAGAAALGTTLNGVRVRGDTVSGQFTQAATAIAGVQDSGGRAFGDVNGHLVTVVVRGLTEMPIPADLAATLARGTLDAMQTANQPANPAPDA